jgi:hypothetical protein
VKADRVLAEHYGSTDEELDFVINYDIKYRLGADEGEEQVDSGPRHTKPSNRLTRSQGGDRP